MRDVMVDNVIVDFSAADMSGTIAHGCPPLEMSCDCGGGTCEQVWNGSICTGNSESILSYDLAASDSSSSCQVPRLLLPWIPVMSTSPLVSQWSSLL